MRSHGFLDVKWWLKYKSLPILWRWFLQFLALMLIIAFIFAPKKRPIDYTDISFESSANSRLYFHNVRSFFYRIDTRSKAPMLIHRLKRRIPERDSLNLNFDIIRQSAADEAFIFSYLGNHFQNFDSLSLKFSAYADGESLSNLRNEDHFRIAAKTYSSFLKEEPIYLMQGSDTIQELFSDRAAFIDAEITLEDYFKLVQKN